MFCFCRVLYNLKFGSNNLKLTVNLFFIVFPSLLSHFCEYNRSCASLWWTAHDITLVSKESIILNKMNIQDRKVFDESSASYTFWSANQIADNKKHNLILIFSVVSLVSSLIFLSFFFSSRFICWTRNAFCFCFSRYSCCCFRFLPRLQRLFRSYSHSYFIVSWYLETICLSPMCSIGFIEKSLAGNYLFRTGMPKYENGVCFSSANQLFIISTT